MKNNIVHVLLLLVGSLALIVSAVTATDSYAPPKQHCFEKCSRYTTIKGKCADYEWTGTKKQCCLWKTVGKGKCAEYKKISKCDSYSKAEKLCIGHGYTQVCKKVTKHKFCSKYEWKEVCKHQGKNHGCDKYAYNFICTKFDKSQGCSLYTYVPKVQYHYKKRCARYSVQQYCSQYKSIHKTIQKWVPVYGKHYKGWVDKYFHQVLEKKSKSICVAYAKKKFCTKHQRVRFAKKIGYEKKCVKFFQKKYCVAKKKVRFCEKWTPNKFCDLKEKVRVCKKHVEQKFCCDYKAVPFCTQYKSVKPRCNKRSHKKVCVRKSPGQKVCAKYEFVGGKKVCRKFADKSVCAKKEKVCTDIDTYHK